jgi:hypothetical protein
MDICLHDLFFQFCLWHYPPLLQEDDEVFETFVRFLHGLLRETVRKEREAQARRLRRTFPC